MTTACPPSMTPAFILCMFAPSHFVYSLVLIFRTALTFHSRLTAQLVSLFFSWCLCPSLLTESPFFPLLAREEPTWTSNLLTLYLGTIDAFSQYENVLAFNIGNEVVIDVDSTIATPFIKAAARDVKAYLASKSSDVLVGYASTDGSVWRDPLADYLTCESDDTSIDLWGLNN